MPGKRFQIEIASNSARKKLSEKKSTLLKVSANRLQLSDCNVPSSQKITAQDKSQIMSQGFDFKE